LGATGNGPGASALAEGVAVASALADGEAAWLGSDAVAVGLGVGAGVPGSAVVEDPVVARQAARSTTRPRVRAEPARRQWWIIGHMVAGRRVRRKARMVLLDLTVP